VRVPVLGHVRACPIAHKRGGRKDLISSVVRESG